MKKLVCLLLPFLPFILNAQLAIHENRPVFYQNSQAVISAPQEGLWAISNTWENDWPDKWHYADPNKIEKTGEWTVLSGQMQFPEGIMLLRDSYREVREGLVQCIRRFEWKGEETLSKATLSVRFQVKGEQLQPLLPGILYYGNSMGTQVNPNLIPVYTGEPGEFAIFEDHRYPIPFAMLENIHDGFSATIHTTPSPVRGAVLADQWWSMGVEAYKGYSELVLLSGPIGYNKQRGVAKALQQRPMKYTDTYLTISPGRIIEKEFYIEVNPVKEQGSGFQQPLYTALDIYKPFYSEAFTDFETIVKGKYEFAKTRWIDAPAETGFNMYDPSYQQHIVMGWCGQADSPGYALQVLNQLLDDSSIKDKVQQSLDFLTKYPIHADGTFNVIYDVATQTYSGGDHVSCGQAMYNFSKAIETARRTGEYQTEKWEAFLKKVCDRQSKRILSDAWNPHSTAEGFYIAPLIIASRLFNNKTYEQAAVKAGQLFADRHLQMNGAYWGGTLDATCEDKEGAWAAFQGFLELYERLGDQKYLKWAKHAMDVCLTYVVVWDIPLPPGRMADYNFKSTGWTVVSPQNQHIDVYGVLFAPEVYKMGLHLGDERLQKLAAVMYRTCYQLTDPFGSQGEQLQQTNFAQHGDMSDVLNLRGGYSEGWTVFWITAHFLNAAARFLEIEGGDTP